MQQYLKIIFLFILIIPVFLFSQEEYPKDYFTSPVDFNMALSGTFGELRTNHFHSGIDIKTFGVLGKQLKAVADGFVSRVAVSPGGFGKAVYVQHPNGYSSVYAHCRSFSKEINDWVKSEQYRLQSFQVNLFPDENQFVVKQGEVIAFSGNSGGSMGPHLHFEIRETNGQIPVNPLLFGFDVKDYIRPKINKLKVYPFDNYSFINGKHQTLEPKLAGWGLEYRIISDDTLNLCGKFYFGISTHDRLNDSNNKNGVFSIELFLDSVLVYSHKMVSIPFTEGRYVNSLIDYADYKTEKIRFQKTYIEPNNQLSVYDMFSGNGVFCFIDDEIHHLEYVVKDAHKNESRLNFYIKSSPPDFTDVITIKPTKQENIFYWDTDNEFNAEGIRMLVPKGALYDTLNFIFSMEESGLDYFSPIYKIHFSGKAIHKYCELSIRPVGLPDDMADKALIVKIDEDNIIAAGGKFDGKWMKTRIRSFGNYTIAIDSTPPQITPINVYHRKNISGQKTIKIKIEDELSGIKNIEARLNDRWVLMDWDPKNDRLTYFIDERMKSGENRFELEVEDERGNISNFETIIVW